MEFCPALANLTIPNTSRHWRDAFNSQIYNLTGSSYLRPDIGGALLPWIYTAIVIVVHIPTVIIRVQRWEMVQTWCLAATLLTVVLYAQAYVSTAFAAEQVLTWTPLLLVIDAGSMLQLSCWSLRPVRWCCVKGACEVGDSCGGCGRDLLPRAYVEGMSAT
jgi:hypothetical protein